MNNVFLNDTKPWILAKEENKEAELQTVVLITLEALRVSAILLQPIVPNISDKILNKLNVNSCERLWNNAKHVFDSKTSNNIINEQKSVLFSKIK